MSQLSLARQVDLAIRELADELRHLNSGIVFLQIRNNEIGKFGIRHDPIECKDGVMTERGSGLSDAHIRAFAQLAVQSLSRKNNWTHGEIAIEFRLKQNTLMSSIQFESNYNMSNLMIRRTQMQYRNAQFVKE